MNLFNQEFRNLQEQTEGFDLAIRFFLAFSRFEYALKRAGYTNPERADADWDKFCSKYKDSFSLDQPPGNLINGSYLLEEPPQKQILVDNQLDWSNTNEQKEQIIFTLSRYARRVRNNLFHGEKFRMILKNNSRRNVQLVQASLDVVSVFLELDESVKDYFYRGIN